MIVKVKNRNNFAQIQNSTLRDKRLSLETRGALGEILTYSEDFETSVESLMTLWEIGRDKLLKITNQLKEFGYLEIKPVRDAKGKIIDKEWNFYGESQGFDFRNSSKTDLVQDTEKSNVGQNQTLEKTNVGENQSLENTDDLLKYEFKEKYEEKEIETHTENACDEISEDRETDHHESARLNSENFQKVWDFLADERMDTPFENPKWETAIVYAARRKISPEEFIGCIRFLKTDPAQKFRKGRITAEIVTNNLSHYLAATANGVKDGSQKTARQLAIEKCRVCDERGKIKIRDEWSDCRHNG